MYSAANSSNLHPCTMLQSLSDTFHSYKGLVPNFYYAVYLSPPFLPYTEHMKKDMTQALSSMMVSSLPPVAAIDYICSDGLDHSAQQSCF